MNYNYKVLTKAVSPEYCDFVANDLAMRFPEVQATTGATKEQIKETGDKRKSRIRWIAPRQDTRELYNFLEYLIAGVNRMNYGFDISLGVENFQYTEYLGDEKGHYSWHMDSHHGPSFSDRKISMSLQLSDPSEYEGGQFCIDKHAVGPDIMDPNVLAPKGSIIIFPSYIQHCVTPVTKGLRKSLVGWWCGQPYR